MKEKQKADAVTEAGLSVSCARLSQSPDDRQELRQTLHRTEKTSALKEAGMVTDISYSSDCIDDTKDLKREIQALNASREAIIATETGECLLSFVAVLH